MYLQCVTRYTYIVHVYALIIVDLIERKRVSAERQALEERERRERMDLEEAFRDNNKTIPGEVRPAQCPCD